MKVGIIGGGASGMMAAHTASKYGHKVTILERMPRIGKKLLTTGSGRCNLTNEDMDISHFHSGRVDLIESVLNEFSKDDTLIEFASMGLHTLCKNGYYYPYSEQANSVLDVLRYALIKDKVTIINDFNVSNVKHNGDSRTFTVYSDDNRSYKFDRLIICAGSKAAPKTGSDGSGYMIAKQMGHTVIKPLQALCGLKCEGINFKSVSGIRCKGSVTIISDNKILGSNRGEIQLTGYGISGIPVMQVSYLAAKAIDKGKTVTARLSFLPDYDEESLLDYINQRISNNPEYTSEEFMAGLFHKNLGLMLLKRSSINTSLPCSRIASREIKSLINNILNLELEVTSVNSFDDSQVCQGGVSLDEIKTSLESKIIPGLYFAGELLDVNGDCGGYNLQWAWSSGCIAGRLG